MTLKNVFTDFKKCFGDKDMQCDKGMTKLL